MDSIKLVGWDLDGTLIDTKDQLALIDIEVICEFTGKRYTLEEYYKIFDPTADWFKHFEEFGIPTKDKQEAALKRFLELEAVLSPVSIIPGALEIVKYIKSQKIPQHLITRHDSMLTVKNKLHQTALRSYFPDDAITMTSRHKAKDIIFVCQKYDINPDEMIFITDTAKDVEEGIKAGVKTIAIYGPTSFHTKRQLEDAKPWKLIGNVLEIQRLLLLDKIDKS